MQLSLFKGHKYRPSRKRNQLQEAAHLLREFHRAGVEDFDEDEL